MSTENYSLEQKLTALETITDREWSPINLFTLKGNIHPEHLTKSESFILKIFARILPISILGMIIHQFAGQDGKNDFISKISL